jgi:EAL domain-containing protein (putative c-di-GMP-specific phosphodiesterase class I)
VADRIINDLGQPIRVEQQPLEIGCSVGIALYPRHGLNADTLLKHADVAMYTAKRYRIGRTVYAADPEGNHRPLSLIGELREAIAGDQLRVYYHPKIDLKTMRAAGAEALVRWQHPAEGLIVPADFVPLAERTGLIRPLGLWVLEAALQQCRAWRQAELPLDVSVNLAADHVHDEQLSNMMARLLDQTAATPGWLTVEVTEGAIMADSARAKVMLGRLHDIGVKIAIDDFGTGRSSLAWLKRLPVDELKVDRSFVTHMCADRQGARLVKVLIDMSHSLGLRVVAEGVEDAASLDLLASWGCDDAQGYHFSRALSAADFQTSVATDFELADCQGRFPMRRVSEDLIMDIA